MVEPPVPATAAIAFSKASRVRICDGRVSERTRSITIRPASTAAFGLPSCVAGMPERPRGLMPRKSITIAIVLAVNWPPQAPAPGQATSSSSCTSSSVIVPAARAPTASNTSWIVTSLAAEAAGRDRAVVEDEAGDVEPRERHHRAGDRLVAADEADEAVEEVAVGDELDRVGDHLARDQRGAHAGRAHRDAVGDRDRVELDRRAAGRADPVLHVLGEHALVQVARHRLDPGRRDADERLREILVGEADALQHRARGRAVDAVGEERAAALGRDRSAASRRSFGPPPRARRS